MDSKQSPGKGESLARKRYFSQFEDTMLINTALALDLSAHECRLFLLLAGMAGDDNIVLVPSAELAEMLGIERSNYQRLIKQLEAKGIVAKVPGPGRVVYRMVNPDFLLKCGPSRARKVLERWDYELRSDRNKETLKGLDWLRERSIPPYDLAELKGRARARVPKQPS